MPTDEGHRLWGPSSTLAKAFGSFFEHFRGPGIDESPIWKIGDPGRRLRIKVELEEGGIHGHPRYNPLHG